MVSTVRYENLREVQNKNFYLVENQNDNSTHETCKC